MPLFTDALLGDTLHLSAEEFGAYCMILFATWSNGGQALPDDDAELARICRISTRKWRSKLRPKVIGFFDVSDGFLHQKRLEKEWHRVQQLIENGRKGGLASAAARSSKAPSKPPTETQANPQAKPQAPIPRLRPRKKEEENPPPPPDSTAARASAPTQRSPDGEREEEDSGFQQFWNAYPRRVNRGRAFSAFLTARKTVPLKTLLEGARRYAAGNEGKALQWVAMPENWLTAQRWLDEPPDEVVMAADPAPIIAPGSDDEWRRRMRLMRDNYEQYEEFSIRAHWPREDGCGRLPWGVPPGFPGCDVPAHVLAEFPQVLAGKAYPA